MKFALEIFVVFLLFSLAYAGSDSQIYHQKDCLLSGLDDDIMHLIMEYGFDVSGLFNFLAKNMLLGRIS